jgi:hypothetical protein
MLFISGVIFYYFALPVYHILCVIAVALRDGSNRMIVTCYCNRFFYSWVHFVFIILFYFFKWYEKKLYGIQLSWSLTTLKLKMRKTELDSKVFYLEYWALHRVQKWSKLKMMLMICIRINSQIVHFSIFCVCPSSTYVSVTYSYYYKYSCTHSY